MSDWIEWNGGECQVEEGTLVDVKYRGGSENHHVEAGVICSSGSNPDRCAVNFGHYDRDYDIIAYRLHEPGQESKPLTQQLSEAVAKRDKYSRKADKWAQRFADQVAEVSRIAGELEREIEEATGLVCTIRHKQTGGIPDSSIPVGVQVHSDIPEGVDVDDPKTWRDGDVIKCVSTMDEALTVGKLYTYITGDNCFPVRVKEDDDGVNNGFPYPFSKFRFARRPSEG